jgi:hypothetical protein
LGRHPEEFTVGSFSNGDIVRVGGTGSDITGTIAYGPFRALPSGPDRYMVMKEDGTAVSALATNISAHVAFAVGEEAEERAMGRTVKIVAGPFKGLSGTDRYVVQMIAQGHHAWVTGSGLRKVVPVAKPAPQWVLGPFTEAVRRFQESTSTAAYESRLTRAFLYGGRTYSLDGEYADRQGDVWKFNGRQSPTGLPLMDCALYPNFRDFTLADVINSYGPLSRA